MNVLLALVLLAALPDTLRLDDCYRLAEEHYPLRQELALQAAITELKVQNLNARYLPALSFNGQAGYQSEVPAIPLDVPGATLPDVSKDQYRAALSVEQLIYDGGLIARQKALEHVQGDLARQEVAVALYRLREQVNAAFFGVLISQARQASLRTLEEDIRARLGLVEARVRQGVVPAGGADVLAAELIKIEQQQTEAEATRLAALDALGELLGRTLAEDAVLVMPEPSLEGVRVAARQRPEYAVFALKRARLDRQQQLSARKNRPQVSGFTEAAYGRPQGLDFFENDFGPFYTLGLRVRWPFWDWRTARREREVLALQQRVVQAQEETFAQQIRLAARQDLRDLARLDALLEKDEAVIELRRRITAQAASQLENGVITATDYLIERNAEHQARLTQQLHRIQRAQARVRYLTTVGGR